MNRNEEKIFEIINEIKKLNELKRNVIEDCDKKINEKEREINKLRRISIFEKKMSYDIITSLVSKIDGKQYKWMCKDKFPYYNGMYKYVFLEPVNSENGFYTFKLAMECEKTELIDYSKNCLLPDVTKNIGYPCIVDGSHNYILEFMNYVIEYRLKNLNYDICEEELKMLVDSFSSRYIGKINEGNNKKIKN